MKKNTYVAIMAGGIGSRFWPASRIQKPKQFLDILGTGSTLIQATYDRVKAICPEENIYVITNRQYVHLVKEQLPRMKNAQIIAEPARKNTAPCIAYMAFKLAAKNKDAQLVVCPSDHIMESKRRFNAALKKALDYSKGKDVLVTLGMKPTRPATGYGYIQFRENTKVADGVFKVKTFIEKPDLKLATRFIKSGEFLWNAGIFIWSAEAIISAFETHLKDLYDVFNEGSKVYNTNKERDFINNAYSLCKNISIDYGIMEKAENVYVVPSDFGWSDLGTWTSLYNAYKKDYLGNAVAGKNTLIFDATNCMVMSNDKKLVAVQGLEDFIVVDSDDVLLICHKSQEQTIKEMVSEVKRKTKDKFI